jgi:adenylosuccinate lyase
VAAAVTRRQGGAGDDLVTRLASDPRIPLDRDRLAALLADPVSFTGTAVEQVARVVARCRAVVDRHPDAAEAAAEIRF